MIIQNTFEADRVIAISQTALTYTLTPWSQIPVV